MRCAGVRKEIERPENQFEPESDYKSARRSLSPCRFATTAFHPGYISVLLLGHSEQPERRSYPAVHESILHHPLGGRARAVGILHGLLSSSAAFRPLHAQVGVQGWVCNGATPLRRWHVTLLAGCADRPLLVLPVCAFCHGQWTGFSDRKSTRLNSSH